MYGINQIHGIVQSKYFKRFLTERKNFVVIEYYTLFSIKFFKAVLALLDAQIQTAFLAPENTPLLETIHLVVQSLLATNSGMAWGFFS